MIIRFEYNDGDKSLSNYPNSKNDCVVRAIAIALKLDYNTAFNIMNICGRRSNGGLTTKAWLTTLSSYVTKLDFKGTVENFYRDNQTGRFIIEINRHIFALVDGVIQDTHLNYVKWTVVNVWKVN